MRYSLMTLTVVCGFTLVSCDGAAESPTAPQSDSELTVPTLTSDRTTPRAQVGGGGHIREGEWDISLAGQARVMGGEAVPIWSDGIQFDDVKGSWLVQFHHVSWPPLDGSTFKSTRVQRLQFFANEGQFGCGAGVRVHLEGRLDGAPGWTALVVVVDGADGFGDTVLARIWGSAGEYYATNGDFSLESTCAGDKRTVLDTGNLTVSYPG